MVALTACSGQQWYEAVQGSQRHECHTMKRQSDYEACMARYDTSYQDYQRERKAVLDSEGT